MPNNSHWSHDSIGVLSYILEMLVLSANYSEGNRVAARVRRDIAHLTATGTGHVGTDSRGFGGFLDQSATDVLRAIAHSLIASNYRGSGTPALGEILDS